MTHEAVEQGPFGQRYALFKEAFESLGADLTTPSGDGFVCTVRYLDNFISFTADALPNNSASSWNIAKDKLGTYQLASEAGISVPKTVSLFRAEFPSSPPLSPLDRRRIRSTLSLQLPACFSSDERVIVKPGRLSKGRGVRACRGIDDVLDALEEALAAGHYALVQEYIAGREYRVVILGGEVLLCYEKQNPAVVGDGRRTVRELLTDLSAACGEDLFLRSPLVRQARLDMELIPETGQTVEIEAEVSNLSAGATPLIVNNPPHQLLETALAVHRLLGLTYSGMDLRVTASGNCVLIEANGNPGFNVLNITHPEVVAGIMKKVAKSILALIPLQR